MDTNETKGFWEAALDPFFMPLARLLDGPKAKQVRAKRRLALAQIPESHGLEYCTEYHISDYLVRFGKVSIVVIHGGMPIAYAHIRDYELCRGEYQVACHIVRELRQSYRIRRI